MMMSAIEILAVFAGGVGLGIMIVISELGAGK